MSYHNFSKEKNYKNLNSISGEKKAYIISFQGIQFDQI